jgi:cytochrome P450
MPTSTDTPRVLADLAEPENVADPYPYLARIREKHPVHRTEDGYFLVARHADIMRVYSTEFRRPDPDEMSEIFPLAARYSTPRMLTGMVSMLNPPEHTRLRRFFTQAFGMRQVTRMREVMDSVCAELLGAIEGPLRDGETVDVHQSISTKLPARAVSAAVGIPDADRDHLFGLMPAVLRGLSPAPPEHAMKAADRATEEITAYFAVLAEQRRRAPGDDLVSAWVRAHDETGALSEEQLASILWGMIVGGLATTMSALSSGMLAMARDRALASWLRGGEGAVRAFAQEVVRHESPSIIGSMPYYCARDVVLSGVEVPAHTPVRAMPAAGNRDPSAFPEPDRFDPGRDVSRTLAFGHGIHHCLGMNFAMLELTTALAMLHRRFPGLVLAGPPQWGNWLPIRSLSALPVRLERP